MKRSTLLSQSGLQHKTSKNTFAFHTREKITKELNAESIFKNQFCVQLFCYTNPQLKAYQNLQQFFSQYKA